MRTAAAAALAFVLGAGPAAAQPWPRVGEIVFDGNETTERSILAREMVIVVGDPADPVKIERSRQGIQDLGLFQWVTVIEQPLPDGSMRLLYTVKEKWYVLPLPRYDVNTEGEYAYGLQLRWYNVWGLNHTMKGTWAVRDEKRENADVRTSYSLSYDVPLVANTPYSIALTGSYVHTPVVEPMVYDEIVETAGFSVGRALGHYGPASVGWSVRAGFDYSNQRTHGGAAPEAYGEATALGLGAGYKDLRQNIYSEVGTQSSFAIRTAVKGYGSDYSFNQLTAAHARYLPVGQTPNQTAHVFAEGGAYAGGPTQATVTEGPYSLGGNSRLRAYPSHELEGDYYYYLSGEFARPVGWDWLRIAGIVELGNAFPDAEDITLHRVYADVGLSLRLRVTFLVDIEVECGVAWPLDARDDWRFFASKI